MTKKSVIIFTEMARMATYSDRSVRSWNQHCPLSPFSSCHRVQVESMSLPKMIGPGREPIESNR